MPNQTDRTTDKAPVAAPALKEIFDRARLEHIGTQAKAVWPRFDVTRFMTLATENLDDLGIMQRMRQTATSLHATLPQDFETAADILDGLAPRIQHGFASIALCEYAALYGAEHFDRSMRSLHFLTRFGSAEFAIRPFLARNLERTLGVMRDWAEDDNEHVRRLASEGSRPRLPWSFNLRPVMADPSLTAPILDALQRDPSPYVRKSVANHLNDITKDNPGWALERVSAWDRSHKDTAWIVRHALRSLIKMGDARALALIGTTGKAEVTVECFTVAPARVRLGERLTVSAAILSAGAAEQRLVVDYAIHYVKKNGTSKKVFKFKELSLPAGSRSDLSIGQTIRNFTTRKHFAGHHKVTLIVNGEALAEGGFDLTDGR